MLFMRVRQFAGLFTSALLLACLCLVYGCSSFNGTRLEPLLGGDVNLVKLGDQIAKTLVEQAEPPLYPRQPDQPVMVTTFVDNRRLGQTSDFGRHLQNTVISGLVQRGITSKEVKLRGDVLIKAEGGEFMLSRDLSEIMRKQQAQAVVVGTYTMANRVMYLSVRLVSPEDRVIRAAFDDRLYLDENTLRMLNLQYADAAKGGVAPPSPSFLDSIFY